MSENDDLVGDIFAWVGTAISTFFYISPVIPYFKLLKGETDIKHVPGILLICSFMNCILWENYGLLLDRFLVYFPNGLGGVITLVWITIYLIHSAKRQFCFAFLYTSILIAGIIGLSLLCFFVLKDKICGKVAMVFNVLMYAAPGEKMLTVCKTGKYNLIPIWSTIGGTACSACWLIYGIYQEDLNMIIPNALGVLCSIIQIVVFIIFKSRYKENKNEGKESEGKESENED